MGINTRRLSGWPAQEARNHIPRECGTYHLLRWKALFPLFKKFHPSIADLESFFVFVVVGVLGTTKNQKNLSHTGGILLTTGSNIYQH